MLPGNDVERGLLCILFFAECHLSVVEKTISSWCSVASFGKRQGMGRPCLHSSRICSRTSGEILACFEVDPCFLQFLLQSGIWSVTVHGIAIFFKGIIFWGSVMVSIVIFGNAECCKRLWFALFYVQYSFFSRGLIYCFHHLLTVACQWLCCKGNSLSHKTKVWE